VIVARDRRIPVSGGAPADASAPPNRSHGNGKPSLDDSGEHHVVLP